MLERALTRRLFVVPIGENNHGKTTMIEALVAQGERRVVKKVIRGPKTLYSPWGRVIDALIIPRSYQETLRKEFGDPKKALQKVDPLWRQRDLVVFPTHIDKSACFKLVRLAHSAGYDAIAVPILLAPSELPLLDPCLRLRWNDRWTLSNPTTASPAGQVEALGHDLWCWIAGALERR